MRKIKEVADQILFWEPNNGVQELYAKDDIIGTLAIRHVFHFTLNHKVFRGIIKSGDGSCEFDYIKGFLRPKYAANASQASSLKAQAAIFSPIGNPLTVRTHWYLKFHAGPEYRWREKTDGKWIVFDENNPSLIEYRSEVNYKSFYWVPKFNGQIQISESMRSHPDLSLLIYWGWYLSVRHINVFAEMESSVGVGV